MSLSGVDYRLQVIESGEIVVSQTREKSLEALKRLREKYGAGAGISLRIDRRCREEDGIPIERYGAPAPNPAVYFIQNTQNGLIKIGSSSNPQKRLSTLQTASAGPMVLLAATSSYTESGLHRRFKSLRVRGEWFRPEAELLQLIEEEKDRVKRVDNNAD
jgi:hypothetical protein